MNTPTNGAQPKVFRLPPPNPHAPLLNRVISNPLFNEQPDALTWKIGDDHPLAGGWKVVRMFLDPAAGVEIYAIPPPDKSGHFTRNFIPIASVRFTEEVMAVDVFVEELTVAEEDDDDDDDYPGALDPVEEEPAVSDGSASS